MDNITAESSDVMINQLNFGLPETAQCITDRRQVNCFPSGSNVYASNAGNKNICFYISGDANQYLDLSSVRLFATLQNTDGTRAKFLRPLGGLHAFFNRYRCTVGGQIVQDIVEYNRHCELFKSFKSKDVNEMDDIENSANPSYDDDYKYANGLDNLIQDTTDGATNAGGVATVSTGGDRNEWGRIDLRHTRHSLCGISGANGKVRLGHKPCCGLLESNYYLPLRFAPLESEFTIVSDGTEPVVVPQGNGTTQTDKNGYYFQDGNTSTSWEINNVIIRADVITVDNTVDNNITKHLSEGQSLKLIVPQYHSITQTFNTGGGEINMNIVKSASKLIRGGEIYANYLVDNYGYKRWNSFYNPMINGQINDGGDPESIPAQAGKGFADSSRALALSITGAVEKKSRVRSSEFVRGILLFTTHIVIYEC